MTDKPRLWLITGAAGTLGAELTRQVMARGDDCIALDRDEGGLNRLHDSLSEAGHSAPMLVPLDLAGASPEDYAKVAEGIAQQFGRLDCLVHNAAAFTALRPLPHQPPEEWMRILQTGLTGPQLLSSALMPLLSSTAGSRLVFIADRHCLERPAHWGAYGVAQAGRRWLVSALERELGGADPQLRDIDPGPFYSKLRTAAWPVARPDEFEPIDRLAERVLAEIGK